MKGNHFQTIILGVSVGLSLSACQSRTSGQVERGDRPAGSAAANATSSKSNSTVSDEKRAIKRDENSVEEELLTPTGAYKSAYVARKNKDIDLLKRVLSKDMLEFFTMVGESDKRTLEDVLRQMTDKPQGPSDETRNEKISGSTATLDYRDENGKWKKMDLVKEGSDWKLTIPNLAKKR